MQQRIDTDRIRQNTDLIDLAGQVTTLRKWAAKERAGPCPKCGGTDRLHVLSDWAYCNQCWRAEKGTAHDAIAFTQWLHDVPFVEACRLLDDGALPMPTAKAVPVVKSPGWDDPHWQEAAQREARDATEELEGDRGEGARAYLASRGITPETWRAWSLGCGFRWNPRLDESRGAVVLPWSDGDSIRALQYRFYDRDIGKDERFSQRKGGERVLFGLDMLRGGDALLLIEGELNAISAWQAARGSGLDVVSFGSEGNAASDAVKELAGRYQRVVVWADEAAKVAEAMAAIPGARGLQSMKRDGVKLDANELLQQGFLVDFLAAACIGHFCRP